jgi:hypothetical protein
MRTIETAVSKPDIRRLSQLSLNPQFFSELLKMLHQGGLVGEDKNALVLYLAATSRQRERPLNVLVKGSSSSGKNFTVKKVLELIPSSEIHEITSSSGASWNYHGTNLQHKIVYIQEENDASGNVHPARLLMSENRLVRLITKRRNGQLVTERQVTEGPVACISTTTKDRLEVDDETRHISVWIDETSEQTRQILQSTVEESQGLGPEETQILQGLQPYFALRAKVPIVMPKWLKIVADQVSVEQLSARRYFPAFLDACKVVSMIRSFGRKEKEFNGVIQLAFSDYAVATLILDEALGNSLNKASDEEIETKRWVQALVNEKRRGIQASDLSKAQSLSEHLAYARLRTAAEAGVIQRSNPSEKGNRKLYLPAVSQSFLPDPANVFNQIAKPGKRVAFFHPVTGELVVYEK